MANRRKFKRYETNDLKAGIYGPEIGVGVSGAICNVSQGGMLLRCKCPSAVEEGTKVEFKVEIFRGERAQLRGNALINRAVHYVGANSYDRDLGIKFEKVLEKEDIDDMKITLQELLDKPEKAKSWEVLLSADDYAKRAGRPVPAVFETIAGRLQKEYITVWGLLEHPDADELFIRPFIQKAKEIRETHYFDAIVTATITGRKILERVQAPLEETGPLLSHVIARDHNYPLQRPDSLDGKRCLLLTDVIASGKLLENMTNHVRRSYGIPVSILSAVRGFPLDEDFTCSEKLSKCFTKGSKPDSLVFEVERVDYDDDKNKNDDGGKIANRPTVKIPVFSLAEYPVVEADDGTFEGQHKIPVDPTTVFPEERIITKKIPIFNMETTIRHLEKADAMDFGFFQAGSRVINIGVRIKKLLEDEDTRSKIGKEILLKNESFCGREANRKGWLAHIATIAGKVNHWFSGAIQCSNSAYGDETGRKGRLPVIVTTVGMVEQYFSGFVKDLFSVPESHVVFFRERESIEDNFFLSPDSTEKIRNNDVLLVMGTVQTSSKLQAIAAILVANGAASLQVICLVNRMGVYTTNFISRIRNLMRTIGREESKFDFTSVYEIPDLGHNFNGIVRKGMLSLVERYERFAKSKSLLGITSERIRFLEARNLRSDSFLNGTCNKLPDSVDAVIQFGDAQQKWRVSTLEGLMFCHVLNMIPKRTINPNGNGSKTEFEIDAGRNPSTVVDTLQWLDDPGAINYLVTVLIADIPLLKRQLYSGPNQNQEMNRERRSVFTALSEILHERLREVRKIRLKAVDSEERYNNDPVFNGLEATLIQAVGTISYYADRDDEGELILDAVTMGQRDSRQFWRLPTKEVFMDYMGDERIVWAISWWMHCAFPSFSRAEVAKSFKEELYTYLKRIDRVIVNKKIPEDKNEKERIVRLVQQVRTNIGYLLEEAGYYGGKLPHQIIRHLHRELFADALRHNPIFVMLEDIPRKMGRVFQKGTSGGTKVAYIDDERHQQLLDQAKVWLLRIEGLRNLAKKAERLFRFTPAPGKEARPFTHPDERNSLMSKIERIRQIVTSTVEGKRIISQEVDEVNELIPSIFGWLGGDVGSPLVSAIMYYYVDLSKLFWQKMDDFQRNQEINRKWEGWSIKENILNDSHEDPKKNVYVLCDPGLLGEAITNILKNAVKHGACKGEISAEKFDRRNEWEWKDDSGILPRNSAEMDRRIKITFTSHNGKSFHGNTESLPRDSTLLKQFNELGLYDATGSIQGVGDNLVHCTLDLRVRSWAHMEVGKAGGDFRKS